MEPPKNQKQVRLLIGLLNYYMDLWSKWSHLLQPLTALTSKKVNFIWTFVEQKPFNEIKQIVTRDILLIYPDFNKRCDIHTYASELQLGVLIRKLGKPISFYIHKLTKLQQRYTVMEN